MRSDRLHWDNSAMRFVLRALALWALVAFVFWVAVTVIPGIELPSFRAALATTAVIAPAADSAVRARNLVVLVGVMTVISLLR